MTFIDGMHLINKTDSSPLLSVSVILVYETWSCSKTTTWNADLHLRHVNSEQVLAGGSCFSVCVPKKATTFLKHIRNLFPFLKDLSVTAHSLHMGRSNNIASSIIQNQAPMSTKYTVIGLIPHGQMCHYQYGECSKCFQK